jgi:hypothetical protein
MMEKKSVTPFIAFATMSEPIAIGSSSVVVDSFSKFEETAGREASQQLSGNGTTFSRTIGGTGEWQIAEEPLPHATSNHAVLL